MRIRLPKISGALVALTALALVAGPAIAQPTVLLPYGADVGTPGYRYMIQDTGLPFPAGFESPGFDDSGPEWGDGIAPFGGLGGNPIDYCPDIFHWIQTSWDSRDSDMVARFHVDLCDGAVTDVKVGVSIDNDIALWVNGFPVTPTPPCTNTSPDGLCETEFCATFDKVVFEVPDAYLQPGDNLFVFQARDRGIVAYLDAQVTGDTTNMNCSPPPENEPPVCEGASADPGSLWPPNHKWNSIGIVGVTDPDGDPLAIEITSIFQDEPVDANGNGDGKTCPDGDGVGTDTAWVRAERAGGADGRVYHIGFEATDGQGGTCQGVATVCVPHDQGNGSSCIDQGPLFDSTTCP